MKITREKLVNLAKRRDSVESQIDKTVDHLLKNSAQINEENFWDLVYNLFGLWQSKGGDFNAMKWATDEFIRQLVHNQQNPAIALSFVAKYDNKVDALYKPLFNVIKGVGDDGYCDILDSFPLFGSERFKMALMGKIQGKSKDQFQGENYVRMYLHKALNRRVGFLLDEPYKSVV